MNFEIIKFEVRPLKILLAITLIGVTANAISETLTFSSFRIEVEDAWVNSLEKTPQAHNEMGELISIYHPNGNGVLKMQTISAPGFVTLGNCALARVGIPITTIRATSTCRIKALTFMRLLLQAPAETRFKSLHMSSSIANQTGSQLHDQT